MTTEKPFSLNKHSISSKECLQQPDLDRTYLICMLTWYLVFWAPLTRTKPVLEYLLMML
jgi:hypothetical protein